MANSDINGFPRSGLPVLNDDVSNICLNTLYGRPLKIAGFIIDVVGSNRLLGALTIGGALTGATTGTFSAGISATTGTFSSTITGTTITGTGLVLGTGSISLTGSIGTTLFRPLKGWFKDLDITNMPTVNGESLMGIIHNSVHNNIVRLKGYTVATLPTGTIGDTAYASDLLTPTYLGVAVGGGAVVGKVFYDGTNWIT